MWDVDRDAFDTLKGAEILEIAKFSLDEPSLKAVVVVDEGNEDSDDPIEIGEK